ncbi:MAG: CoB--CoM heterodisulfide reductase iron-sulfur subunit B family protein [Actinomycetota bacterium]|nr:CoB--CoM heterodisulfide reductase iron-sulfur subunit B family protein [Actinomycetota bacterium]
MKNLSFSYYPGCSQSGSAEEYGLSCEALCKALEIELIEIPDWNCCGASSAHMTDDFLSVALPARNLAIAKERGLDILVACAACYSRMRIAQQRLLEDEELAMNVERTIGMNPRFDGSIRHLLDVIVNDVGLANMKKWKRNDLSGIRAVPYYGCLLVRPREICALGSTENPTELDELLRFAGVEVIDWSYKTDCCGGRLSLSRSDIVHRLVSELFSRAKEAGANSIVTACPMCASNLEMRQSPSRLRFSIVHEMPVFYFTELLGIALGLSGSLGWLKRHIISPVPLLRSAGIGIS